MSFTFLRGTRGGETLTRTAGNDAILGLGEPDRLIGNGGENRFLFNDAAEFLSAGRMIQGAADGDALVFRGAVTIGDAGFGGVSGVEQIRLLGAGMSSLTLGPLADAAFDGAIRIVATNPAAVLDLDARALVAAQAVVAVGKAGADTIRGGAGDDSFLFDTEAEFLAPGWWLDSGAGLDTLIFQGAVFLADAAFTGVAGMEAIRLAGAGVNALTLGAQASQAFAGGLSVAVTHAASQLVLLGGGLAAGTALRMAHQEPPPRSRLRTAHRYRRNPHPHRRHRQHAPPHRVAASTSQTRSQSIFMPSGSAWRLGKCVKATSWSRFAVSGRGEAAPERDRPDWSRHGFRRGSLVHPLGIRPWLEALLTWPDA